MTSSTVPVSLRLGAGLAGAVCLALGALLLAGAVQALLSVQRAAELFSSRDTMFVLTWCVFAASVVAAGVSLLWSAWRARARNLVPGPTLYVGGVSLMVIAMFLVAAGAPGPAAAAAVVATALMMTEYFSETV
ncbi:MAG: hypothetical protein AAFU65_12490 [Pseudomonadota bacterium]